MTANFIGGWSAKTHWEVYQKAADSAGGEASREIWRVARSIHVGESDGDAEAFVKAKGSPFDHYYSYLFTLWSRDNIQGAYLPHPELKAADVDYTALRDNYVIWGNPATVARKLMEFREEVGHVGHLLMTGHDWTDKARMRRSMALMARDVMPAVSKATGAVV